MTTAASSISTLSVVVACRMMDGESCDYAADIIDALRQASLSVPDLVRTSLNDQPGYVAVHLPAQATGAQANQMMEVLAAGGVNAKREQILANSIGALKPGHFYIVVGRKAP
jgi:hypothetical protein